MKSFGKILSLVLICIMLMTICVSAAQNKEYADTLYDLGLFRGTDKGYELDRGFTREEAATVLVRLLGEEEMAYKASYDEVFDDVSSDSWSFPYVMYCYENDITKGTGKNTFSPKVTISAEEFVTLVMRLLGYSDTEPETALEECVYANLINSEIARGLKKSEEFLRDDMVYIVYRSLMTRNSDGKILADELADKGVISKKEASEFDIYETASDMDELIDRLLN